MFGGVILKWVVLECPWKGPTRWPPTLTISTWLNIQSIQIFLSSLIFWSILLTYFVFFKITLCGLHLLPIYGWNILFPLVLIGWVTKKGRNWLKSPQIDYLLDYRTAAQRDSELFITTMITDLIGRHEVLSPIYHKNYNFREKKYGQVTRERENLHLIDWY